MSSGDETFDREQLLLRALEDVLVPLATLCVGHGLPFARAEELFKRAYVRAAREARRKAGAGGHRDVSQVAVATGLNRRDVVRISAELTPRAVQRMSPATQVFGRWLSDPAYRHANGRVRKLPRQGPAPSFESLAQSVTRHVHPRSLLDELLRLNLAALDPATDQVSVLRDRAVPDADEPRLYGFLGANVGDHLAAASENVLSRERRHLEQSVFTNSLSAEAVAQARELVQKHWRELLGAMAPALEQLIQDDQAAGRAATHRLRVGLYSYHDTLPPDEQPQEDDDLPPHT